MTDIGFGLADKRSVLVILFVLLLGSLILGYPPKIDTSNAVNLFIDLAVLTGFIYITRIVFRILIIAIYALLRAPIDLLGELMYAFIAAKRATRENENRTERKNLFNEAKQILGEALERTFIEAIAKPLAIRDWRLSVEDKRLSSIWGRSIDLLILGILDRLFLIFIVFLSMLPSMGLVKQLVGIAGISFLLIVYVVTGRFTFIMQDAFHKAEDEHKELVKAAETKPDINFPKVIETKPYHPDY